MSKTKKHAFQKILMHILNVYTAIGILLVTIATVLFITPALPYLWYRFNDDATNQEVEHIASPTHENSSANSNPVPETSLPPFDETLPTTNILSIPSIGVYGEIHEGSIAKSALEKGVWRVDTFGTPEDSASMILASHRFGYLTWSSSFRTANSFFNLPKTKVGDTVEIIWNQRSYTYRIYKTEDTTAIDDYSADLILYTCRLFNSPVRVFRYAERE